MLVITYDFVLEYRFAIKAIDNGISLELGWKRLYLTIKSKNHAS